MTKIVRQANRNMGMIMRNSKYLKNTSSLKVLFFALVRSYLEYASTIWHPTSKLHTRKLEQIQKRFLRFLYYKDFGYYDYSITYNELVEGYELTTLGIRRDLALLLLLRDILTARLHSPFLLGKVNIYAPSRNCRTRGLFHMSMHRTTQCISLPLNRAMNLYNKLSSIDPEIDIFFGGKMKYKERVIHALIQLHT